jgi:hypothetical protein
MEIWKDIKDFNGYQVSDLGRVRSFWNNARRLKEIPTIRKAILKNRYYQIVLKKDGNAHAKYVQRLVAEAFIPNPNNYPTVDHIDRNSENNKVKNLRWATYQMQTDNSNIPFGERTGSSKLKDCDILQIKKLVASGVKRKDVAEKYKVGKTTINKVVSGSNWSHIK